MEILTEHFQKLDDGNAEGYFILEDETHIDFYIDKDLGSWQQWGGTNEELGHTVNRLEELTQEHLYGKY